MISTTPERLKKCAKVTKRRTKKPEETRPHVLATIDRLYEVRRRLETKLIKHKKWGCLKAFDFSRANREEVSYMLEKPDYDFNVKKAP